MTAALNVDWTSGGPFLVIFLTGTIIGAGLTWALAGLHTLDSQQQHAQTIRALRRIFVGLHAGWTHQQAIDEAARALHLDDQEHAHG